MTRAQTACASPDTSSSARDDIGRKGEQCFFLASSWSCPVLSSRSEVQRSEFQRREAKLEAIGASACVGMFFLNGLILYVCIRLVLYVYAGASNAISRELLREAGMSKGFVVMFWQLVFICCFVEGAWL